MGTIVIGYDGSEAGTAALDAGVREAELRGGEVMVVETWLDPAFGSPAVGMAYVDPAQIEAEIGAGLRDVVARFATSHPHVPFRVELRHEAPRRAILDAVEETSAELVVVGSRGRGGFARLLLGSVSHAVAAEASVPVLVTRAQAPADGEVVVGFDGGAEGRGALRWAAEEAGRRKVPLRAVMAWSFYAPQGPDGPIESDELYSQATADAVSTAIAGDVLGQTAATDVHIEAPNELAAKALVERSATAGLLVIGPRHGSLDRHLDSGSVTLQVLHHAACPVAVVPAS